MKLLIAIGAVMLLVALFFLGETSGTRDPVLSVYFLDVGQGDATLIESPDGTQVLIDGGPDSSVLRELGKILGFFDRDIDMIIATHPDADHIGGLIAVLDRYTVGTIVLTQNNSDTPAAGLFLEQVQREGAEIIDARSGQMFTFGGAELRILFPDRDVSGLESNTASIVSQLVYGNTEFLFTGDSPKAIEEYLVGVYGDGLRSDVLKIGHHGSKTSTAEAFASTVDPDYGIISAGKDNTYGHPHQEVLDTLRSRGVETKNTAEVGSILIESDGTSVRLK